MFATTVTVPDDFSTVQAAINSGADTVQIRPGTYPERPLVDRPLVLQGIGDGQPQLDGLEITNLNFSPSPRLLSVSQVRFLGRVNHTTVVVHPRLLNFSFTQCALDSGFQAFIDDQFDLGSLGFRQCHLSGQSDAWADQIIMEADTIDGQVSWSTEGSVFIRDCWFRGGPGIGIGLSGMPAGIAKGNRIENYERGISASNMRTFMFEDNYITRCGIGMRLSSGDYVYVTNNELRDCSEGVVALLGDSVYVRRNRVLGSNLAGIRGNFVFGFVAEQNVVGRSGGAGFYLEALTSPIVRGNTMYENGASGIEVFGHLEGPVLVENNIGFGNDGWGLKIPADVAVELGCNDWFGNGLGAISGAAIDSTDLNVDPLFCSVDSDDVRLKGMSPLVDRPECGPIGALGVGCVGTATVLQMLTVAQEERRAVVRWRFGSDRPTRCWAERRSDQQGPWHRILIEPHEKDGEYVQTDENLQAGITYWYRIGWTESAEVVYSDPVSFTFEQPISLSKVLPNPSYGPVNIQWELESPANLDVCIYDLAGRQVAAPARGWYERGRHKAYWNGQLLDGGEVRPGWYVVRIRGKTFEAAHMLLQIR